MNYFFLCMAILSEVVATSALSCTAAQPAASQVPEINLARVPAGKTPDTGSIPSALPNLDALEARLAELSAKAGGKVGASIVHVESGRTVTVGGRQWLPLQSVFKVPLAVAVLRGVQEGQLSLDRELTINAEDRAPGVAANAKKWAHVPRTVRVRQLLEYSLVDSDNTSSDKLLGLVGGPEQLTERIRALGFEGIAVRAPTKAMGPQGELPNDALPEALARLLAAVERGEVLEAPERALLSDLMGRASTGERRIRAGLPPGTPVLDKTGTGAKGIVTNDVGVVTLPDGKGHLALAVLISGSSLPAAAQEDLIAEMAHAAFECFVNVR
jgi:beta-lactamase class A